MYKNMVDVEPYAMADTSHSKITEQKKKINIYAIKMSS